MTNELESMRAEKSKVSRLKRAVFETVETMPPPAAPE